jgi:hypothetical protein
MSKSFRPVYLAILVSFFTVTTAHAEVRGGSHSAPILITQKVDDTNLVTLYGNHRGVGRSAEDLGAVPGNFQLDHMLLQLKRSPQQEKALEALMEQQYVKSSPEYHHWLSESEFDEAFGVNRMDLEKVNQWLASYGFTVNGVTPDGLVIDFSGTASMVRKAFHTDIHNVQLKNKEKHFFNTSDPRVPLALAQVIVGPVALHDFKPHPLARLRSPVWIDKSGQVHVAETVTNGAYTFSGCGDNCYAFTPGDAQTIYNIAPLLKKGITGKGQTIGLIEDSNDYKDADWSTFISTFGLSGYNGTLATNHPGGSMTCTDPGDTNNGTDVEVELDVEYASATAPGANVVIESCADSTTAFGGLLAVENLASATNITTPILSISYDECEVLNGSANNAAYSSAYQHAASRGISIFVASGDDSSTLCDGNEGYNYAEYGVNISGFASTPYNVAVGGTDFGDTYAGNNFSYWSSTNAANYSSALSYVPEIPWNDSCASQLIATIEGYSTTYGSNGFCNSAIGSTDFLTLSAGSGGPSNCYSGSTSMAGVGASGTCRGQPKPSWQAVYGNPSDGVRDIPDVSLFAANGVWGHYLIICMSSQSEGGAPCTAGDPSVWTGLGGTSAATPMMAGIQALVNQSTGQMQGNPAPTYYILASLEYGQNGDPSCNSTLGSDVGASCVFYDVTQGDMNAPCFYYGSVNYVYNCYFGSADGNNELGVGSVSDTAYSPTYGSSPGWDFATGIGSVNALNLVSNWDSATLSTATALTANPPAVPEGMSVALTATVMAANGVGTAGTVTFQSGSEKLGSCKLANGTCTYSASTKGIAPGMYSVSTIYSGSGGYMPSRSPAISVLVGSSNSNVTTTTFTATPNPVPSGNNVTLTATVTADNGGTPTGRVQFQYGSGVLGTCTLISGSCTYTASSSGLPLGTYNVLAAFTGAGTYLPSSSASASINVETIGTYTILTANPNPLIAGDVAVLTGIVIYNSNLTQEPAPGAVTFLYGTEVVGSCVLTAGSCTYSASSRGLAPGAYGITASYSGSVGFQRSTSSVVTVTVTSP